MEYIKQLLDSNNMFAYIIAFVILVLILGIALFFIRKRNLVSPAVLDTANVINQNVIQSGEVSALSKDHTLNVLMNSEELVNNSFVMSAEEYAAKKMASAATNAGSVPNLTPTNTATASNIVNETNRS